MGRRITDCTDPPAVRWTIEIPRWVPALANTYRGRHWSREAKAKREAEELIAAYSKYFRGPPVPAATGRRRVSVVITLRPRQQQPDRDAADKVLLDALVRCGLLLDDGERGLAGRVEVTFERGPERATTITLEEV